MKIQQINQLNQNYYNKNIKPSFKGMENMNSLINTDRMTDQFIKMVKIDTGSDPEKGDAGCYPSTQTQLDFAKILAADLKKTGLQEIKISEHGILTATLPGNIPNSEELPVIGLIAHLDTALGVPTGPVNPKIHKKYQGGDIKLNNELKVSKDDLKGHIGEDVITTDGNTLLGADDKAGIAEIMEVLNVYKEHPEIKHPKIRIAFTPDEEIGNGTVNFDIKDFGADIAYTIDGDAPECIDKETWNAYNPEIKIKGEDIHPGDAFGKMVNAVKIATKFIMSLPNDESPETTKDRQGFYHADEVKGTPGEATIKMLVRDFDLDNAKKRVEFVEQLAKKIEKENPGSSITVSPNPKYFNMLEKFKELPEVLYYAKEGVKRTGLTPKEQSVRGGTDGSHLTLEGLLTPNLGAGGHNIHALNEFVTVQDMSKCATNILNIVDVWTEKSIKNEDSIVDKVAKRRELSITLPD